MRAHRTASAAAIDAADAGFGGMGKHGRARLGRALALASPAARSVLPTRDLAAWARETTSFLEPPMRYQGTAVQIYDIPLPAGVDARINRRMAMLVSMIGLVGLLGFLGFLVFGIISQRL